MTMLNHPLVQSYPFNPAKAAVQNRQYDVKTKAVRDAQKKKDWHAFVFLHERPYRANALTVVQIEDPSTSHHELIANVWTDSENIWQSQRDWERLFKHLPDRHLLMDDDERRAFARLKERITIFRGLRSPRHNKLGISWTTDRTKAEWFARRYALPNIRPCVAIGEACKSDVIAHFLGRGENEIVILSEHVRRRYKLDYLD
jgi:hypothetical protein